MPDAPVGLSASTKRKIDSVMVVSPDFTQALILHHVKQDQWFQPGGHADGDNDVLRVALRETSEETGLDPDQIQLLSDEVFDVDIQAHERLFRELSGADRRRIANALRELLDAFEDPEGP